MCTFQLVLVWEKYADRELAKVQIQVACRSFVERGVQENEIKKNPKNKKPIFLKTLIFFE